MDERDLVRVRARLEDFAAGIFAGLRRSDQRATGLRYLRGLMLDGRRKSMQPMAQRLGVDHQQLQQFLTSSTWADAGYGQVAEFRQGLTERGIGYIVATTSSTTAQPGDAQPVEVPYAGVGPHPTPRYPHSARSLKDLALAHGADAARLVRWRARLPAPERTPDRPVGELSGHFFALRVRPAGRVIQRGPHRGDDGVLPECWLLVQWPPDQDEPSDYWLSDLPADTPLAELVRLAKSRWRIEHDYRELKTALGLDHFEGRSWIGWHRHVTLASAAQLFLTQLRLARPKAVGRT
ncbi:transposase [Micromonospora sp. NPDC005220]|uniref:IS701 family transposase n=1 Tax=Micromonospora sp. NPDC005220 TaxID=3155589 RepID=UPI0033B89156